ncbi:MAG: hypothetical protein COC00_002565 [Rhizobiales bacterium]|nr:hypothetical protein [Hyphomicrobiales bacterium]
MVHDIKDIISNFESLKAKGELEEKLIPAYLHARHFEGIPFETLKNLFDSCDRELLLQKAKEHGYDKPERHHSQSSNPFTIFRGCVGNDFREGISWTTDLYQAIKYPKLSKINQSYGNNDKQPCSIWCALVEKDEVYCYLSHYEPELIVCPKTYWRVDVPQKIFGEKRKHIPS